MSQTTHLITNNILAPGFGPEDRRSLPCSGFSRRVNAFSWSYTLGDHSLLTRVKFISNERVSKAASVLRGARPGNNKRNPDFTNPSDQGFPSNIKWNEDRDNNDEGPDESDIMASTNGTLSSSSSSSKSQAHAGPGNKKKEIRKLFEEVREKLERAAAKKVQTDVVQGKGNEEIAKSKEVKMIGTVKGKGNEEIVKSKEVKMTEIVKEKGDEEFVKSKEVKMTYTVKEKGDEGYVGEIIDILRSRPTGDRSEKVGASNNGSATSGLKATNGSQNERSPSISNMFERIITPKPKAAPVNNRPASSFRRTSPIPTIKYKPIYNNEDDDNDHGEQQPELDEDSESDEEFVSDQVLMPEPIFSLDDEYIIAGVAEGETSKDEYSLDDGNQQPTEHKDLSSLKLAELRALAKSSGVKGFSKMNKSKLVELLSG